MTNKTIEQMMSRRSVRAFTGEAVKQDDLNLILKAGQQAPTSINGQQISLVVTQDKETIKKIAEIAGGQPQVAGADVFITVVMDYVRPGFATYLAGEEIVIEKSAEGLLVGAVDAGIMTNALQTAAESLGYGSTAIGGIRRAPEAMIELLGLPQRTFPINGLTLGVPDKAKLSGVKPRVPLESFAMFEKYDAQKVADGVKRYEATLQEWWNEQGLPEMPSYSASTAGYYKSIYFPKVAPVLRSQGFDMERPEWMPESDVFDG
ncbi:MULTISPECIES: nitroreductase family protein [Pseudovibrio]|uniref:nitroreductase family protein n=1 Tax=Stappiaceae TaxID=2821832 RepID=UPI002365C72B|nr:MULTISPECIES: nitroreductase family protein [Pseudovibrio]MDD7910811.1 nitroreductase family protein [Pseudovibrio exalbescens]MDX5593481.1 nitroreductase family protein [Pseudovibrio sp. SPO723]